MIAFISCGSRKRNECCAAKDLYTGHYFRMCLAYAEYLGADKIYILSAKYGVLELEDKVSPYNISLCNCGLRKQKLWAQMCYEQMIKKNINFNDRAIFLGGKNYWRYLSRLFADKVIPFEGKKNGIQFILMREEIQKNVHCNKAD